MGLSFLTPLFLAGFLAVTVPIVVHLIRRHQGKRLDFPSLMFLRQLPVQSVQRMRIRDWPLLLLRAGALALIIMAFARPVLQLGTTEEGVEGDGLRDVVLTLDRSWSMTRGDRWAQAVTEARTVLDGLVSPDRVSLVVFDGTGRVVVEPTLDPGRIRSALDTLSAGWAGTQIGAGLQAAGGVLQASERSRREVVLISDFQRRGWEDGPRDRLPPGTLLTPIDVGDDGLGTMIVTEVALEHSFFEGRQRVHPVVRVVRQGEDAPTTARLVLEMDGRELESRTVELPSEGASAVAFEPVTLPDEGVRGAIRLAPEGAPAEEPFRFFFSPQEVLSILLVEGSAAAQSPFLRRALALQGGSPVRVQSRTGTAFTTADLQGIDLVVLNDTPLPSGASANLLREHISAGGGLFIVAGPASGPAGWESEWDAFLPGRPGTTIDRNPSRGGSLARIDRDHPVFSPFTGVEGAGLGSPQFFRYRALALPEQAGGPGDANESELRGPQVIARFDDGAPALVERTVGSGKVTIWTSTLDTEWTDIPLHPVFVPMVREIARFTSARRESLPYFTVGQPLDGRFLLGEDTGPGSALPVAAEAGPPGPVQGILVGPGGAGIELRGTAGELVELSTPGFYEVRDGDESGPVARILAVNPDAREADPARMDPAELVIAVAPRPGLGGEGEDDFDVAGSSFLFDGPDRGTVLQEGERRQGAWRFLLLGAIVLLLAETLLAGRSKPLAKAG